MAARRAGGTSTGGRLRTATGGHVPEVVLVQDHPVVLEAEPAREFGVDRIRARRLALAAQTLQLLGEGIGALHIALVELQVLLDLLVRDPGEPVHLRES